MLGLIWFLVIGIVAGWLAGQVMRGKGFGLLGDMLIGIIGSCIGWFVFGMLGFHAWGTIARVIVAFVGAVILLAVARMFR